MSGADEPVGYKRPPKNTRWRKGQSGNPQGARSQPAQSLAELIDSLLLEAIQIVESGEKKSIPKLEAVMLQLWAKELAGNRRAVKVRLKYHRFVGHSTERKTQLIFVDSSYTRALAAGARASGSTDA
jgi:hypothetical protein